MRSPLGHLLLRWLILSIGVALAAQIVPGIWAERAGALVAVAALLGLFNVVLKPMLVIFTLPFILFTMGLGVVVINALLFLLAGRLVDGFHVAGFWAALFGSLVVSLTNLAASRFLRGPPPPARRRPPGDVIDI